MKRDLRFPILLSSEEKSALQRLAQRERIPAAAVVRRLIWREAERLNVTADQPGAAQTDQHAQTQVQKVRRGG